MQIHKAAQDLPCPALQNLIIHMLVLLAVPTAVRSASNPPVVEKQEQLPGAVKMGVLLTVAEFLK